MTTKDIVSGPTGAMERYSYATEDIYSSSIASDDDVTAFTDIFPSGSLPTGGKSGRCNGKLIIG